MQTPPRLQAPPSQIKYWISSFTYTSEKQIYDALLPAVRHWLTASRLKKNKKPRGIGCHGVLQGLNRQILMHGKVPDSFEMLPGTQQRLLKIPAPSQEPVFYIYFLINSQSPCLHLGLLTRPSGPGTPLSTLISLQFRQHSRFPPLKGRGQHFPPATELPIICAGKKKKPNSTWSHVDFLRGSATIKQTTTTTKKLHVSNCSDQRKTGRVYVNSEAVPIRRNAPRSGRQKKRPPTGQVAVITDSLDPHFSEFLGNRSDRKTPSIEGLYKGDLLHSLAGRLLGGLAQLCVLLLNGVKRRVVANLQLKQE